MLESSTRTPEDVVRVAKAYFKDSNSTVGEFIPTASPDRAVIPEAPSFESQFRNFKSSMKISQGAEFDPTPANIEKHLTRVKLPDGLKLVMLPKTTRGEAVAVAIELNFGDEKSLSGQRAVGSMAGSMLMRGTLRHTGGTPIGELDGRRKSRN